MFSPTLFVISNSCAQVTLFVMLNSLISIWKMSFHISIVLVFFLIHLPYQSALYIDCWHGVVLWLLQNLLSKSSQADSLLVHSSMLWESYTLNTIGCNLNVKSCFRAFLRWLGRTIALKRRELQVLYPKPFFIWTNWTMSAANYWCHESKHCCCS